MRPRLTVQVEMDVLGVPTWQRSSWRSPRNNQPQGLAYDQRMTSNAGVIQGSYQQWPTMQGLYAEKNNKKQQPTMRDEQWTNKQLERAYKQMNKQQVWSRSNEPTIWDDRNKNQRDRRGITNQHRARKKVAGLYSKLSNTGNTPSEEAADFQPTNVSEGFTTQAPNLGTKKNAWILQNHQQLIVLFP